MPMQPRRRNRRRINLAYLLIVLVSCRNEKARTNPGYQRLQSRNAGDDNGNVHLDGRPVGNMHTFKRQVRGHGGEVEDVQTYD